MKIMNTSHNVDEFLFDFNNLTCRTCLVVGAETKSVFESDNVLDSLTALTELRIDKNDGMPNQICTECINKLNLAHSFKELCKQSDESLKQRLQNNSETWNVPQYRPQIDNSIKYNDYSGENYNSHNSCKSLLKGHGHVSEYYGTEEGTSESNDPLFLENINPKCDIISDICKENINKQINISNEIIKDDSDFVVTLEPSCEFCNKKFCNKYYLKVHIANVHKDNKVIGRTSNKKKSTTKVTKNFHNLESSAKDYFCKDCGKQFVKLVSLNLHRRVHTPGYTKLRHQCTYCGKLFERPADCREHSRTHTGEQPFQCNHCPKKYSHRKSLIFHMIKHSEENYVICPVCGKCLASRGCLDAHMKTHNGVRKHACAICSKAFYFKSQLSVHMRQHTGEKPYKCNICDSKFATTGELKSHQRKHTGNRLFLCSVCSKKFVSLSGLHAHLKSHLKCKSYYCEMCKKAVINAAAAKTHCTLLKCLL